MVKTVVRSRERREAMVSRIRILAAALWALLAVVVGSFWVVQGVHGAEYREQAEHNRLRRLPTRAPRGVIADRNGRPLAENVPSYDLLFRPRQARSLERSLQFAASVLDRDSGELESALERQAGGDDVRPLRLAESLTLAQVSRFELATLEHPEFEIEVEQLRLYRHREQTAHVLGYLSEIGPEELQKPPGDYLRGDQIGRRGIESRYEEVLRGRNGEVELVVDSRGRTVEQLAYTPAEPGTNVRLAIDLALQQTAHRMLAGQVGAVVAMNPRSGEVRALVSSPSYDPNLFARRLDASAWSALLEAPHQPLQNRAVQNAHSPGSVFKIVMALAGLERGVVTTESRVFCRGSAVFYNHRFRCWKRAGHGWVDLHDALKHSCDVYFYELGSQLGIEQIAGYARRFGFAARRGIDLGGEKAGLVPSAAWSLQVRGHPWYPGETISVSIGQGPLLVTPLQVAVMMSAMATRGSLPTPRLAEHALGGPSASVSIPPAVWQIVHDALVAVVEDGGSGRTARLGGLTMAGKTGTVQVVSQSTWTSAEELPFEQRDHAWFASYAPADDPELVVVVFVEHGGAGSRAAAPVARAIYEEFLKQRPDLRDPPPA